MERPDTNREQARQKNGEFGTQQVGEVEVDLVTAPTPGPRRVNTDGLVTRAFKRSMSTKSHAFAWKIHTPDCRYAGDGTKPMAELVDAFGEASIRTKINVGGAVVACAVCKPTLLRPADDTQPDADAELPASLWPPPGLASLDSELRRVADDYPRCGVRDDLLDLAENLHTSDYDPISIAYEVEDLAFSIESNMDDDDFTSTDGPDAANELEGLIKQLRNEEFGVDAAAPADAAVPVDR